MFLNPLMLCWGAGAATPVLIHLLGRARAKPVAWGAMLFLPGGAGAIDGGWRLKQWTLLGLRATAVGLLAVAAARPVVGANRWWVPTAGLTTGGRTAAIILLDASASSGYVADGKSRLDLSREVALQILPAVKPGDEVGLVVTGQSPPVAVVPPGEDLQQVAGKITDQKPGTAAANFAAALNRAADALADSDAPDRQIYVVCDHTAAGWRDATEEFFRRWRDRWSGPTGVGLTVFFTGGFQADNLAVDAVRFPGPPPVKDVPAQAQVHVRNTGPDPVVDVPLSLWTGPRTLAETAVTLAGHSAQWVTLTARFNEAGSKVVSAAITSTGLTADDRADVSIDVVDPPLVRILSDDGDPTAGAVAAAVAPFNAVGRRGGSDPAVVVGSSVQGWVDHPDGQVVCLCGSPSLSPVQQQAVEKFARAGGGVLVVPGEKTTAAVLNKLSTRGGGLLLDAAVGDPVTSPARWTAFDRNRPEFWFLTGKSDATRGAEFRRHFPLPLRGTARSLATLSDGDPLLIDGPLGAGHVVLMTACPQGPGSNLSGQPLFLPLMQSLVRGLAGREAGDRNLSPGQPIVLPVPAPPDRGATVQRMTTARREPAIVERAGEQTTVRFTRTEEPGVYRVRYVVGGAEKVVNVLVVRPTDTTDLTPLTDRQWQPIAAGLRADTVDPVATPAATPVADVVKRPRGGRELWVDLVVAVAALLAVETALSRFWNDRV